MLTILAVVALVVLQNLDKALLTYDDVRITSSSPGAGDYDIVFLPPLQTGGDEFFEQILAAPELQRILLGASQAHVVNYPRKDFDTVTIAEAVRRSADSRKVVLVGASLGAKLALDIYKPGMDARFVLIDPAISPGVITLPLWPTKLWEVGPVQNWALGWLMPAWHNPPPNVEPTSPAALERHYQASRTQPLSGWVMAARYLADDQPLRATNQPARALRAEHDTLVSDTTQALHQSFGYGVPTQMVPGTHHASLAEYPRRWAGPLATAINEVLAS